MNSTFDQYSARLSEAQRTILQRTAAHQLSKGEATPGRCVCVQFPPEHEEELQAVLKSLVPDYLQQDGEPPYDRYVVTPAGLLLSPGGSRASMLIEDMLQFFRGRLSQDASFSEYTWDDLKKRGLATGDSEFILINTIVVTMGLHDGGSSTSGPPPSFKYRIPADASSLRRFNSFDQLLELRQKQYDERRRASFELQRPVNRPSPEAAVAVHQYYGPVHHAPTYNSTISGSTVGALAVGDHAQATGTVNLDTAPLTQEQHRAALKEAQKALIDDEDRLDELVYEALGQFLRLAREIPVEHKTLAQVQAAMKRTVDEIWAGQISKGMKPKALPQTLAVLGALAKHPAAGEVVKKLLEA